ncbi:MAG TPA: hypothetical protein VK790_07995 [Solirubrobacteraceae bacterium]|nr:hypothetical protein [Solirubrobacteraceae bacterium]
MKRFRRLGVCLAIAVAAAAVTASAATAALPEFVGPQPLAFTSMLKPSTVEVAGGGIKVSCTGGSNAGEVTGPKSLTVKIKLVGCTVNAVPCRSGVTAGEIETSTLTGTLGYINAAKKQVGLDLSQPAGALFMTFVCGEDLTVDVKGSVIGTIKPVDKVLAPPKRFSVKFAQKKGIQKPTKLEGAAVDILETSVLGGPFEPTGLATTDAIQFAAPLQVAA